MFNITKLHKLMEEYPDLLISQLILDYCSLDFLAEKVDLNYRTVQDLGFDFCNFSSYEKMKVWLELVSCNGVLTRICLWNL